MAETTSETEAKSGVIYWEDLDEKKQAILDVLQRSREPMLWTSEILTEVDFTKPTLLNHLNQLNDLGVVGKKENGDTVWWIEEDANIRPGSKSGVATTINRWFPLSVQSWLDRWVNRLALFGAGLVLLGMFIIITAAYLLALERQPPVILDRSLFSWGLLAGIFGFMLMGLKLGLFIGAYAEVKLEAYWN